MSDVTFTMSGKIYQEIIKQCREQYPHEACGILAGKDGLVQKLYMMENVSENPRVCYFMEPKQQLEIFKEMRQLNLDMLAIYHSHIGVAAYPSKRDIDMAFYPEALYLIISLDDKKVAESRIFSIIDGRIKEEKMEIIDVAKETGEQQ